MKQKFGWRDGDFDLTAGPPKKISDTPPPLDSVEDEEESTAAKAAPPNVVITDADIDAAIAEFDDLLPEKYKGLLGGSAEPDEE